MAADASGSPAASPQAPSSRVPAPRVPSPRTPESPERVRVTVSPDGVARVTLARAARHNGVDTRMMKALVAAGRRLARDRRVRVVIVHGDGPSFCAGLDVKSFFAPTNLVPALVRLAVPGLNGRNLFQEVSLVWRDIPAPVVAAVHGACFGAGLQLALGADLRFCAPDAQLSVMEAKWGLVPDMGGVVLLRQLVRLDVAMDLTLTGRVVLGPEALALGLVTAVGADPLGMAEDWARGLLARSPDAVAAGKRLLHQAWSVSDRAALAAERRWQLRVIGRRNQRLAAARNSTRDGATPPPFVERSIP